MFSGLLVADKKKKEEWKSCWVFGVRLPKTPFRSSYSFLFGACWHLWERKAKRHGRSESLILIWTLMRKYLWKKKWVTVIKIRVFVVLFVFFIMFRFISLRLIQHKFLLCCIYFCLIIIEVKRSTGWQWSGIQYISVWWMSWYLTFDVTAVSEWRSARNINEFMRDI